MSHSAPQDLTRWGLLSKNIIYNILGQGLPLIVGLYAIPKIIEEMGLDRFGFLTLILVMVGCFSLFDLGLGRAIIKVVAEKLGENKRDEIPGLIWSSLLILFVLSLLGSLVVILISPWLVETVLDIPDDLKQDGIESFYLLGVGLPLIILGTGLRGVLEAQQKFILLNFLQVFLGLFNFLGPLIVLQYTHKIVYIVLFLLMLRALATGVYFIGCMRTVENFWLIRRLDMDQIKSLFKLGGWMTVSNVISPIMVYFDRFLIGTLVPLKSLAYYTTPYEIINRLYFFPTALLRVLFPAFSTSLAQSKLLSFQLLDRGGKVIMGILFPICLLIITFGYEGLSFWIGEDFAVNSYRVLQIITIGLFINSLAWVPFAMIQSAGKPDITAKIHMLELPFYIAMVWYLTLYFDVIGAATAWTIRVALDFVLLLFSMSYILNLPSKFIYYTMYRITACVLILAFFSSLSSFQSKIIFSISTLILFSFYVWGFLLEVGGRILLINLFKKNKKLLVDSSKENENLSKANICAIIVTYNPKQDVLLSINRLQGQVGHIIIVDNGSQKDDGVFSHIKKNNPNVTIIYNKWNMGISCALNTGVKKARDLQYKWVGTFDQDSLCSQDMIETMLQTYNEYPEKDKLVLISPTYLDKNTRTFFSQNNWNEVRFARLKSTMASGNLIRAELFDHIGYFDERLFIDYVDHDFCLRIILSDFHIIESSTSILVHNLGQMSLHWFFNRLYSTSNHPAWRRYYITRNRFILYRRYFWLEPQWVIEDFIAFSKETIKIILSEEDSKPKLLNTLKGLRDGLSNRMGYAHE